MEGRYTSPKFKTSADLKMDGWKMILFLLAFGSLLGVSSLPGVYAVHLQFLDHHLTLQFFYGRTRERCFDVTRQEERICHSIIFMRNLFSTEFNILLVDVEVDSANA